MSLFYISKRNIKSNLEEYEELSKLKFKNVYEEISNFLLCFRNFIIKNENCLENRKIFLKIIS